MDSGKMWIQHDRIQDVGARAGYRRMSMKQLLTYSRREYIDGVAEDCADREELPRSRLGMGDQIQPSRQRYEVGRRPDQHAGILEHRGASPKRMRRGIDKKPYK